MSFWVIGSIATSLYIISVHKMHKEPMLVFFFFAFLLIVGMGNRFHFAMLKV